LRQDNFPASLDAGFQSAEITVQGKKYFGVAAVKSPSSGLFKFSVTGYHHGQIRVDSDECNFHASNAYYDFSTVDFSMNMNGHKRCLLAISVSPAFNDKEAGEIVYRGMSGVLLVRHDSRPYLLDAFQGRPGQKFSFPVSVRSDKARLYLAGCVKRNHLLPFSKSIEIEFGLLTEQVICVSDGFLKGNKQDEGVTILFSIYKWDFVSLAAPQIEIVNNQIQVYADRSVSVINYGLESVFSNKASFRLGSDKYIRFMTSKGRSGFCDLTSKEGITCFH
jgi:hypothetical protein